MPPRSKEAAQLLQQLLPVPRRLPRTAQRSLCFYCQTRLLQLHSANRTLPPLTVSAPSSHRVSSRNTFSTSSSLPKKSSSSAKSARKSPAVDSLTHRDAVHIPDNKATRSRDSEIDPYDFSELEAGIAKAGARLKEALVKTKDAGRVTPEMIEALPVEINVKGAETGRGSPHKEKAKVGDLASVVAKGGRSVQIFCAEEAHVKPIASALLASPYSLVPQTTAPHTPGTTSVSQSNPPTSGNPLLITVPVPPVTAETRSLARAEAKKMFDRAAQEVRNARGEAQKRFRKMELGKLVIVDELRKAHKQMEDVVKRGQDEVKKVYEASLKALDG